mmetsp:Transcript_36707/g.92322  ORF Transcript_36707/g.92322 Transcript_36707/m.92322 type:complete len:205 (+) Transcript_36707:1405-2019(+)
MPFSSATKAHNVAEVVGLLRVPLDLLLLLLEGCLVLGRLVPCRLAFRQELRLLGGVGWVVVAVLLEMRDESPWMILAAVLGHGLIRWLLVILLGDVGLVNGAMLGRKGHGALPLLDLLAELGPAKGVGEPVLALKVGSLDVDPVRPLLVRAACQSSLHRVMREKPRVVADVGEGVVFFNELVETIPPCREGPDERRACDAYDLA